MSRIHDALQRAGDDGTSFTRPPPAGPSPEGIPSRPNGLLRAFEERCAPIEWAPDPEAVLFYDEQLRTPGSEEFRTLRSRLDLVRERQPLQKLVITSPLPREGKTFLAANLAQVAAWQRERHVLLIDGDLRSSRLHHTLGVGRDPGLSEYLSGKADEFAIVRRSPLDNFFFIPGGSPAPNASELIANNRFKSLIKRMAAVFDWIIIDSPPVILTADARVIAESCDGVLLVLKSEETAGDLAQLAYQEFRGRPFVGVVLNHADSRSVYGYGYYNEISAKGRNGKR